MNVPLGGVAVRPDGVAVLPDGVTVVEVVAALLTAGVRRVAPTTPPVTIEPPTIAATSTLLRVMFITITSILVWGVVPGFGTITIVMLGAVPRLEMVEEACKFVL